MTDDEIPDTSTLSLASKEPVLVGAFVTWLLVQVGGILVGRTHIFSDSEWSSLSSTLVPIVTAAVIAGIAWVVRKSVKPVAKLGKHEV